MLVSFSLSPVREVEHNGGSAQSWEQDTFSLRCPGMGTNARAETNTPALQLIDEYEPQ